jgi:hypothetical protein
MMQDSQYKLSEASVVRAFSAVKRQIDAHLWSIIRKFKRMTYIPHGQGHGEEFYTGRIRKNHPDDRWILGPTYREIGGTRDATRLKYPQFQNMTPSYMVPDSIKESLKLPSLSKTRLAHLLVWMSYNEFPERIIKQAYISHYGNPSYNEIRFKFFKEFANYCDYVKEGAGWLISKPIKKNVRSSWGKHYIHDDYEFFIETGNARHNIRHLFQAEYIAARNYYTPARFISRSRGELGLNPRFKPSQWERARQHNIERGLHNYNRLHDPLSPYNPESLSFHITDKDLNDLADTRESYNRAINVRRDTSKNPYAKPRRPAAVVFKDKIKRSNHLNTRALTSSRPVNWRTPLNRTSNFQKRKLSSQRTVSQYFGKPKKNSPLDFTYTRNLKKKRPRVNFAGEPIRRQTNTFIPPVEPRIHPLWFEDRAKYERLRKRRKLTY